MTVREKVLQIAEAIRFEDRDRLTWPRPIPEGDVVESDRTAILGPMQRW